MKNTLPVIAFVVIAFVAGALCAKAPQHTGQPGDFQVACGSLNGQVRGGNCVRAGRVLFTRHDFNSTVAR